MTIYVGRWDLLPKKIDNEQFDELAYATEEWVMAEIAREMNALQGEDWFKIGVYTPDEFEQFWRENAGIVDICEKYWIKIF